MEVAANKTLRQIAADLPAGMTSSGDANLTDARNRLIRAKCPANRYRPFGPDGAEHGRQTTGRPRRQLKRAAAILWTQSVRRSS
jgi:hypothetical protein